MRITINGSEVEVQRGEYVLDVARRNNIDIPSLCHDEALGGGACCRICLVEVMANKKSKVVTSCVYPVTEEMEVITDSHKLRRLRRTLLMLLLARAPKNKVIQKMAEEYQAQVVARFSSAAGEDCILCNLCVSACDKLGTSAISTVNRGVTKEVATPFDEPSHSCIGCAACAGVCPTQAIKVSEDNDKRVIWNAEFELIRCSQCNQPFATRQQLEHLNKKLHVDLQAYNAHHLCQTCRARVQVRHNDLSSV
ncbi:2Fe-2S iron-sulfur cluster-binding protein [Dethiobacter alkaliphilus]|uniref:2Fe-2S iron-sulfur cluster-binding protein n=1 Tax=Dethiobacter alkaliphilus TaxID=427926 RepID=UPI002225DCF0|nr:2Fe-2S iron-sulfur cluster-binding protein [Dethiobacter alkaliphilus]MCW3490449.1 2Fe-2S iron-sulfur cluster-binding protein [Dethiobacter alkaliphilus]